MNAKVRSGVAYVIAFLTVLSCILCIGGCTDEEVSEALNNQSLAPRSNGWYWKTELWQRNGFQASIHQVKKQGWIIRLRKNIKPKLPEQHP